MYMAILDDYINLNIETRAIVRDILPIYKGEVKK